MTSAADRFVSCRQTVYNMIERGEIARPVKITPNRVAFPASVVEAWFASKTEAA